VATCSPNMKYSPSNNPTVCDSNIITITDTVRSFFNNYVYYKWQRSTNGGVTWTDVTAPAGPASPVWNGTAWQYVTAYTVPISQTKMANNGDKYRLVVATTLGNLSDVNCSFTDVGNIITLKVITCGNPLTMQLLSFTGQISNDQSVLKWATSIENEQLYFDIERSYDGNTFSGLATLTGYQDHLSGPNDYSYTDPDPVTGKVYYRLKIRNDRGQSNYSRIIQLGVTMNIFSFTSVINPFNNKLVFSISSGHNGKATAELIDQYGRAVKRNSYDIISGVNQLAFENTDIFPAGFYILRVQSEGTILQKKVIKQNNQ
jgi:trimeric autotransporter adhesin